MPVKLNAQNHNQRILQAKPGKFIYIFLIFLFFWNDISIWQQKMNEGIICYAKHSVIWRNRENVFRNNCRNFSVLGGGFIVLLCHVTINFTSSEEFLKRHTQTTLFKNSWKIMRRGKHFSQATIMWRKFPGKWFSSLFSSQLSPSLKTTSSKR